MNIVYNNHHGVTARLGFMFDESLYAFISFSAR